MGARRCEKPCVEESMSRIQTLAALVAAAIPVGAAWAVEPFKTYDNFSTPTLNGALWTDGERSMGIKSKAFHMTQRYYGSDQSNTGSTYDNFRQYMQVPASITEIRAQITVNAYEVNGCAANTSVLSQTRARLNGAFFNLSTPTPGSSTNDVLAQVRVLRLSNSTDPAGVLVVQGAVFQCLNSDCSSSSSIGLVDLGKVNVGTKTTVQMQWDKTNKQFLFSRDAGAESGSVVYVVSDANPPGAPFKALDERQDIAACLGAAPLTGFMDATFDSVAVNKSALP
jgi:hypothetical protein